MKRMKALIPVLALLMLFAVCMFVSTVSAGFDEFGYNDQARIFVGTAESWGYARGWTDAQIDAYFGVYRYDKLSMKWNAEWDRGNAEGWTDVYYAAWETNEWNGAFPGGSGAVWHYKIIWVGPALELSEYWREGGWAIWGQFEVIMDQGIDPNLDEGHIWYALAAPNGFGGI